MAETIPPDIYLEIEQILSIRPITDDSFGGGRFVRQRIENVLRTPCQASWSAAYTVGLGDMTLYKAVCHVDPSFPTVGPPVGSPWPKVPDKKTLVKAMQYAIAKAEGNA